MSNTSKKGRAGKAGNSKIRGSHRAKQSQPLLYVILFVAVGIVMITLNQTRKKNLEHRSGVNNQETAQKTAFTKEGELSFTKGSEIITSIDIEIADDDFQTQRGLMYRRTMKENHGMLFIFEDEQERSFWMSNTYISLDILYVDADKNIVSISENTMPKSEASIPSNHPAKYVVEVNAGFVALHQIKVGDQINFKRTY